MVPVPSSLIGVIPQVLTLLSEPSAWSSGPSFPCCWRRVLEGRSGHVILLLSAVPRLLTSPKQGPASSVWQRRPLQGPSRRAALPPPSHTLSLSRTNLGVLCTLSPLFNWVASSAWSSLPSALQPFIRPLANRHLQADAAFHPLSGLVHSFTGLPPSIPIALCARSVHTAQRGFLLFFCPSIESLCLARGEPSCSACRRN